MNRDAHCVGHRDRPMPGDPVLHVHRTHGGEREVETGDQLHHHRIGQHEGIGERHAVAVTQTGDRGVRGDIRPVDRDVVDSECPNR